MKGPGIKPWYGKAPRNLFNYIEDSESYIVESLQQKMQGAGCVDRNFMGKRFLLSVKNYFTMNDNEGNLKLKTIKNRTTLELIKAKKDC